VKTGSPHTRFAIAALAVLATAVAADDEASVTKEQIAAQLNGVQASDITDSPIPGLYQVTLGAQVAYVTKDGRYVFEGEVYDIQNGENVTEKTRAAARVELLASVPRDEMIVFAPKDGNVKHRITIFTDIDCGYCRQFHRDIQQVNDLGIEVQYLFYPRTGPDTESWHKAEKVWCAKDRNTALTRAKLGGTVPDAVCDADVVREHFELGRRVGVRGTPAVFDANGELLGGYLAPAQLAKLLDQSAQ